MAENLVFLTGNLGSDPEFVPSKDGKAFSKFPIAVNEGYRGKDGNWINKASWFNLICFAEYRQERISRLHKGDTVHIRGRLSQRQYQDKEGRSRFAIEVVVEEIEKIERDPSRQAAQQAAQSGFVQPQAQPRGNPGYAPSQPPAPAPQPAPAYGVPQGYGAQGRIPPQAPQAQGWNGTGPSYQPQPPQGPNGGWNGQR